MKSQFSTKFGPRRNTNIILTDEMYQAVAKLAADHDRSTGHVIRDAIREYFTKRGVSLTAHVAGDNLLEPIPDVTVGGTAAEQTPRRRQRQAASTT